MATGTYQVGAKWRPFAAVTAITNRGVNAVIVFLEGVQKQLKPGTTMRMMKTLPDGREQLVPTDIQVYYPHGVCTVLVEDQSLGY